MTEISLTGAGLKKAFNRRTIFSDISFTLGVHQSLAITGKNGTGKSTLIKIIAGVLSPTAGKVAFRIGEREVASAGVFAIVGLVAPYLQLYDEFSGWENLDLFRRIRGLNIPDDRVEGLLDRVRLAPRQNDQVRTYSSGMKQRLKYAFALLHQPPVLLLDEPSSNLDADGIAIVHEIISEQKERGMVIIATNDRDDLRLCDTVISVQPRE